MKYLLVFAIFIIVDFIFIYKYAVYNYSRNCNKTTKESEEYIRNCIKKFFKEGFKKK